MHTCFSTLPGEFIHKKKKLYMLFIFPEIPRLVHPCYLGQMGAPANYLLPIMSFAAGSSGCSSVISETPLMLASNALQASDDDIISRNSSKKRGKRGSLSKSQSVTKERKQQDLVILCDKKPQQYITSKVSRYNQITNRISGSVSKMSSNIFYSSFH